MVQHVEQKNSSDIARAAIADDERAKMAAMYEETIKDFNEGSIVQGEVLEVRPNEVLIDIGYKSEGVVPANEFEDISTVKPGDKLDVLLDQIEDEQGMVVLSKQKADQKLRWDRMLSNYKEGSTVEGIVRSRVRGGLIVDVNGVEAFLPGSQIDVMPMHNTDSMLGQTFEFKLIKISTERRNIIVSRRELIEERMRAKKKDLLGTIKPGESLDVSAPEGESNRASSGEATLEIEAAGKYRIDADAPEDNDASMVLIRDNAVVAENDDGDGVEDAHDSRIEADLEPGTYTIRVFDRSNDAATIKVTAAAL